MSTRLVLNRHARGCDPEFISTATTPLAFATRPTRRSIRAGGKTVTTLLAIGTLLSTGLADVKSWNAGDGNWTEAGKWTPFGLPLPADIVLIGNTAAAENDWVNLTTNATMIALSITDGMTLDTEASQLNVLGTTTLAGENQPGGAIYSARLLVRNGPSLLDARTGDLTVEDGGALHLADGGIIEIDNVFALEDGGRLFGNGAVRIAGVAPVPMIVDGNVQPDPSGLSIISFGDGRIDLDGGVPGDHMLNITSGRIDGSAFASFSVVAAGLTDTFDEDIRLSSHNELTMDLDEGWSMGPTTQLRVSNRTIFPGPAEIAGAHLTMHGLVKTVGFGAHARFTAPITFEPDAAVEIAGGGFAQFTNDTEIRGGTFTLAEDGTIDFAGPTLMRGGSFQTASDSVADGAVDFLGPTTWNGEIALRGAAAQYGDAFVTGATTITTDTFDLDGDGGTSWSIAHSLMIEADAIDTFGVNTFNGSMSSSGTFAGKLTILLTDPDEPWVMDGSMQLGGVGALMIERVAGSPMDVTGDLSITGGVAISAPARLMNESTTTFAGPSGVLRLLSRSSLETGATLLGAGTIETGTAGELRIGTGATFGDASLVNAGLVTLGDPVGVAFVDRFENAPGGTLSVDVGGALAGTEHDLLLVESAGTTLDGELDVRVIDAGIGIFEPALGQSFTIIESLGAVSGAFTNQPISFVPGMAYRWSVAVQPHAVEITLIDAIPCPADLNGDGQVGAADITILLGSWGPCGGCVADIDRDGAVDAADLTILLGSWGGCSI